MAGYEWKKLLRYRRGGWIVLVLLLAELASILLFTRPFDRNLEENRSVYNEYLAQVEGPLTPEKREWIEGEMKRINAVHSEFEALKTDYYTGALSEEEFRQQYADLQAQDARYPGFSKLYSQYIFVREQPDRQFLYTGGWETLLGNKSPDYLLWLALIFLLAPLFCQEYGCQMDQLLLTQKESAAKGWKAKLLVALALTAGLTALIQGFQVANCALRFGLPHWNYSLHSLVSFGSVEKSMALWQAFALQFSLKELGYLYGCLVILALSVLTKKYALTLMGSLVLLPLPFLTTSAKYFLRLPAPWALSIGTLYLSGDDFEFYAGSPRVFPEVSWKELGLLMAGSAVICLLLIAVLWMRNRNYHVRRKKAKAVALYCLLPLLLLGCGKQEESILYNSFDHNWAVTERYEVVEHSFQQFSLYDRETGTFQTFPAGAFADNGQTALGFFYLDGNTLYSLSQTTWHERFYRESYDRATSLTALDLNTLEERTVYEWNDGSKRFFGLLDRSYSETDPTFGYPFFLYGNTMYFQQDELLKATDLLTGRTETIMDLSSAANFAFDGERLYYLDAYNRLTLRTLSNGSTEALETVIARDFRLTEQGVYFLNIRDKNTLYFWDPEDGSIQKLDDHQDCYNLHRDEKYCWVESMEGLYRVRPDTGESVQVTVPGYASIITSGDLMISEDSENGVLYRIDKDTLEVTVLSETPAE